MADEHPTGPIIGVDERLPPNHWAVQTDAHFNPVKILVAPGLEQRARDIFGPREEFGARMNQQALLLPCPGGCTGSLVKFVELPQVMPGYPLFAVECHCGWRSSPRGTKQDAAFQWNFQRRYDVFCRGSIYQYGFELLGWLKLEHRECRKESCGPCALIAKCEATERAREDAV